MLTLLQALLAIRSRLRRRAPQYRQSRL